MEFNTEKIKKAETFSENGTVLLELFTEHIRILSDEKGAEKINAFYSEMSQSAREYVKNTLYPEKKLEYENDGDMRKRFLYRPYRYRLFCEVSEKNENCISVICKLFFTRKGKILHEDRFGQVWNKSGELVPLRVLLGKDYRRAAAWLSEEEKKKGLSRTDKHSFALKNGCPVFFGVPRQNGRGNITELVYIRE